MPSRPPRQAVGFGPRAGYMDGEFYPGIVRIPTKRRLFLVYQKGPAGITIAGAAAESRKISP